MSVYYSFLSLKAHLNRGSWNIQFRISIQVDAVDICTFIIAITGEVVVVTEDYADTAQDDEERNCHFGVILHVAFVLQVQEEQCWFQ